MVINFAPSPKIESIVESIFSKSSSGHSWTNGEAGAGVAFYSRGMWALYEGVKINLASKGKKTGVVWFPDYFCNEALSPLRTEGIALKFYPVLRNLMPDWLTIENKIKLNGTADLFVLVHYFGFLSPIEKAVAFCEKYNMLLIEDGAHVLRPYKGMGKNNMVIYSPRKLLSVPEIGLLITQESLNTQQEFKKTEYGFVFVFKWVIKRFVQNLMSLLHINWHTLRPKNNSDNHTVSDRKLPHSLSMQMLAIHENKLTHYGKIRRQNYKRLLDSTMELEKIEPLFKSLPDEIVPYTFPIIVKNNHEKIKEELKNFGIPASSWPDLPPEIFESTDSHKEAIWLNQHVLLLPIHQSIKRKEIDYIASSLRIISENI